MHVLSRRAFMAAAAAVALPGPLRATSPTSPKAAFMKQAIQDISTRELSAPASQPRDGAPRASRRYHQPQGLKSVCIPVPFADFDFYYTDGELVWHPRPGQKLKEVRVPDGFCTDLTSVPQVFWSLLPRTGKYAYAAILHDYLYWAQTTTRLEADDTLYAAMEDIQVGRVKLQIIYRSVRTFGGSSWEANIKAKAAGERRLLQRKPSRGELISWDEWRKNPGHFRS